MLIMRRFLLLFLLCLLPLQMSWAAVADYCGHEQDKTAQHFGHHDDEHMGSANSADDGTQPGKSSLGHDHCHLSGFLGVLSAFDIAVSNLSQPPLTHDGRSYLSLAPDKPERPKWFVPA